MSGDFKATPFARVFFLHFLEGFSKEIDHLSLVDFFAFQNFSKKNHMYSQMNCLIENEYIRELSLQKKNTYAFPNELPNWKRIHKGTFPPKKKTTYVLGNFPSKKKNTYVFPNELPNWKRILKGKKREKKVGVLYYGVFYYCEPGVGVLYCGWGY